MWKTFESSAQGRSHIKENTPCQDKTYALTVGDVTTIALADGAGSAKLSHYGAECAVRTIAKELCNKFDSYWDEKDASVAKFRFYQEILRNLRKKAEELSCELKDLASTLLAVSVKDDRFLIFHIGDGVIGYKCSDILKVASAPNNGEFSNTTIFTTSSQAESQTRLIKASSDTIDGFILMSDGPEACLYDHKNKSLAKGLSYMLSDAAKEPEDIVNANIQETMQKTIVKRTFDDCSIVLMTKQAEHESVEGDVQAQEQNNSGLHENVAPQEDTAPNEDEISQSINKSPSEHISHRRNYLLGLVFLAIIIYLVILMIHGSE